MVKALDPERNRIELAREEFLSKGGTIEVLAGPSFKPAPVRYEPPPRPKVVIDDTPKPPTAAAVRQKTRRQQERAERATERAVERSKLVQGVRKLALTMTYAEAMERTSMSRKVLSAIALEGGFNFQTAAHIGYKNLRAHQIDDAQDAKDCERIKAFIEIGLSRTQAMNQMGIRFHRFNRLLNKFNIDYPKRKAGPHPAFFPKAPKQ
ncbi:hypothetical protein [Pseudomonas baetica]|uniref:hypothetical protein n=1 Tax=Pseudomonas baetica TaxID=674054 RepID=UPI0021AB7F0D|nr:hypothetical protein [Pseudomonas baetica]